MFYIKTAFVLLYIALGLYLSYLALAAAVGSYALLFTITSVYTLFWFVVGGAVLIRPKIFVKYFIAVNLAGFLYIFYKIIPEMSVIVWYALWEGQAIKPRTELYFHIDAIVPPLLLVIGLASEGIVSYLFFKKSMVKDGRPNKSLKRDAAKGRRAP